MIKIIEIEEFLDRPNGGIEVELFCALVELYFAICLLLTAQTVINMISLREFYWTIPHYVLAIPWFAASALTMTGLFLYRKGNALCIPLRLWGSRVSVSIWFIVFWSGLFETGGALGSLAFYFLAMIWQIRIMISAQRRTWAARGV